MIIVITASDKFSANAVQDLITDFFSPYADTDLKFGDAEKNFVITCMAEGIPVYDLACGLYPDRIPLYEPESHAETLSDQTTSDHTTEDAEPLEPISERLSDWTMEELKELEQELHHAIRVKENLHPTRYIDGKKQNDNLAVLGHIPVPEPPVITQREQHPNEIKCYKSVRGKIRRANNSKPRPKETEVWLTEEELEKWSAS